jgi:hypothetical protein
MTLDHLKTTLAAMTPGPWTGDRLNGTVKYCVLGADRVPVIRGDSSEYGILRSEDEEGVMAIRNAAPALIECAELLREIRTFAHDDPRWSDKTVRLTNHCMTRINAALARLEGTK